MTTIKPALAKQLADLGLTSTDIEKALARKERGEQAERVAEVFANHHDNLCAFLADLQGVAPLKPSTSEGSSWVGTSGAAEINGLGLKVVVTDKVASAERKAAASA